MKTLAYIRVSTDKQELDTQRLLLLDYAQKQGYLIDAFLEVEASAGKSRESRQLDALFAQLQSGDRLLVAELSRLARNMLEALQLVQELQELDIELHFVRQPELSLKGPHRPLLMAIYSYFAETERAFLSMRTRQALAARKAQGVALGRPKGSKNEITKTLHKHREDIDNYLQKGLSIKAVCILLRASPALQSLSYYQLRYYLRQHKSSN